MTGGGVITMLLSWGFICALTFFCMSRVIRLKDDQAAHIKPIEEIDTGDQE